MAISHTKAQQGEVVGYYFLCTKELSRAPRHGHLSAKARIDMQIWCFYLFISRHDRVRLSSECDTLGSHEHNFNHTKVPSNANISSVCLVAKRNDCSKSNVGSIDGDRLPCAHSEISGPTSPVILLSIYKSSCFHVLDQIRLLLAYRSSTRLISL